MLRTKRIKLLCFLAFLALLLITSLYLHFWLFRPSAQTETIKVDNVQLSLTSELPNYSVQSGSIDQALFVDVMKKIGRWPLTNVPFIGSPENGQWPPSGQYKQISPNNIHIILKPLQNFQVDAQQETNLNARKIYINTFPVGDVIYILSGELSNNGHSLTIPVYVDVNVKSNLSVSLEQFLTDRIFFAIFANLHEPPLSKFGDPDSDYFAKTGVIDHPLFKFNSKLSSDILNYLIPQAYAVGQCQGYVACGSYVAGTNGTCPVISQTCNCSIGGGSCSGSGSACGSYGGTCQCSGGGGGGSCINGSNCPSGGTCSGGTAGGCNYNNPSGGGCNLAVNSCTYPGCGGCTMPGSTCTYLAGGTCTSNGEKPSENGGAACCSGCSQAGSNICQACAPVCTPGAWSACSVTCGGGIQTETDSCGNAHNQTCNTQACATPTPTPIPSGGGGGGGGGGGTCNPSCPTACGQANGCGSNCGTTDEGTPGSIINQSPGDGSNVVGSGNTITLSWDPAANASLYQIEIYPTGTTKGQECSVANSHCPTPFASNSYTLTVDQGVSGYTWQVQGINTKCTGTVGTIAGPWSNPISFSFGGSFSGTFYNDPNNQAQINQSTQLCQLTGASPISPGNGSTVVAQWNNNTQTQTGTINASSYSISNVGYDLNTKVIANPAAPYTCTCPVGCSYSGQVITKGDVDFYISQSQSAWWQTQNGNVFAGNSSGSSIYSKIPATCTAPTCTPALSLLDINGSPNSDGYTVSGGGSIDSTLDPATQYSDLRQDGTTSHISTTALKDAHEDYDYFSQLYSMGSSPQSDSLSGGKPTLSPVNGRAYYSGSDLSIDSAWTVNAGDSIVVFVNGNLTVNQPITVAEGGFLAFIVKGNITFASTLGQADPTSTTAVVQGVYIANQQIIVASSGANDLKFVGAGMFVGWGGVQLNRQYQPTSGNNTAPTDLFIYRPDFQFTIPARMTKPYQLWQETNL